ncbi:EH signature domain-containing protein [Sphingomonas sp. YL-JM2C]
MSGLRAAIERTHAIAATGLAKPPTTQPELRRQLAKLDAVRGEAEPVVELLPFLEHSRAAGTASLARFELNRVLRGAWVDPGFDALGLDAIARAVREPRRSSDQAIIEGYLTYFPFLRPVIEPLGRAAREAADRHDWAWCRRGRRWSLFEPTAGPPKIATEFIRAEIDEANTVLLDTGLGASLAASAYGQSIFAAACDATARLQGSDALVPQRNLLGLFRRNGLAGQLDRLVQALLEPWAAAKPPPAHRKAISDLLLDQIGDPRLQKPRWENIRNTLAQRIGGERAEQTVQVFKRWLTEVAMREFFRAIARTTDRPDQWEQRERFWLAYLDEGLVADAWPALGARARHQIDGLMRQGGERPEHGLIDGGPASSSSIILQIGDLRISEWSDNGACRFWSDSDPDAPRLYAKRYDGTKLRTTTGRQDFEYESHVPASPGWEGKFAGIIHRRTAIPHPRFGRGRGRNWNDRW